MEHNKYIILQSTRLLIYYNNMYNFSDSYLYIQLVCRHFLLLNLMLKGKTIKRFHSYCYFVLLTVYALAKSKTKPSSYRKEFEIVPEHIIKM